VNRRPLGLPPTVWLIAGAHLILDGFGNIYAPLLPLLIPRLDLTLTTVGVLQMCFQLSSSVAQLGFGYLADRWKPRVLLIGGPLLSVAVLSLIGLSTSVWMLAAVLVVGGLGGAAFHPPAAAVVHRESPGRQAFAMSVHITSGAFGQALGPVLFASFAVAWGLSWTPLLMVPVLVPLALWLRRMPAIGRLTERHAQSGLSALRPYARPLTLLYLIVVLRTLTAVSFATFTPVMLTRRGLSVSQAALVSTLFMLATSAGTFIGGALADRFGARRIIITSLVGAVPFLVVAPSLHGWMFVVVLALGGFLLQSTLPVNVTFAQTIAPISAATVSSLMMGFAWGVGGLSAPLVGMLADRAGIAQALTVMAALPLLAALLALPLPDGAGPVAASPAEAAV